MSRRAPRVLIDASNLRSGGGVQVAASFLDEFAGILGSKSSREQFPWLMHTQVEASSDVTREVAATTPQSLDWKECNRPPISARNWGWRRRGFDVSFVVFGPEYGARRSERRIAGFADVTSVYPRPKELSAPGMASMAKQWVRSVTSRAFFARVDVVVVEQTALGEQLCATSGVRPEKIRVIPNSYNAVFDDDSCWSAAPSVPDKPQGHFRLAYIARGYPHKNFDFLGNVAEVLTSEYQLSVQYLVTLDCREWEARSAKFKRHSINLGPRRLVDLPRIYELSDAAIFPSLLEGFSVMPLEAMRMRRPVFASERDFVKSVCGDAAIYFDPAHPEATAGLLAAHLTSPARLAEYVSRADKVIEDLPTARQRALEYIGLIDSELKVAQRG